MASIRRGVGESIRVGDEILITVLELKRGRVLLAVEAPKDVPIVRTNDTAQKV